MQDLPGAPGTARQGRTRTSVSTNDGGTATQPRAPGHGRPPAAQRAAGHGRLSADSGAPGADVPLAIPAGVPGQHCLSAAPTATVPSPAGPRRLRQECLPRVPANPRTLTYMHARQDTAHTRTVYRRATRYAQSRASGKPRPPVATGGPPGGYAPATRVTHSHAHTDLLSQHTTHQVHLAIQVPPRPRSCSTACTGFSRQRQSRAPPPPAHRKPTYPSPVIPPLHMVERGPGDGLKPHHTWHYPCGFGPSEGEARPKPPSLHADSRAGTGRLL